MVVCKRCHEFFGDDDLKQHIYSYVDNINDELRTEPERYSKRLAACEACDSLGNGMCGYCGCFVLVRAAKEHNKCPKPYMDQWNFSFEELPDAGVK